MPTAIDPRFFEAAAKAAELQRLASAAQWEAMERAVAMGLLPVFPVLHVPMPSAPGARPRM
jgi:hypothetical protein